MHLNKLIASCAIAVSFAACQDSKTESYDPSLAPDSTTLNTSPAAATGNTNTVNPLPFAPAANPSVTGTPVVTTAQPVQQVQASNAAGNNPPHGQPGHRCDIPVGAPLNSPAGSVPQPVITQQGNAGSKTSPVTTTVTPVKTVTAPGMNPPHGEPGHRCDIAVGAPLNSPVKKAEAQPVTVPAPAAENAKPAVDTARS